MKLESGIKLTALNTDFKYWIEWKLKFSNNLKAMAISSKAIRFFLLCLIRAYLKYLTSLLKLFAFLKANSGPPVHSHCMFLLFWMGLNDVESCANVITSVSLSAPLYGKRRVLWKFPPEGLWLGCPALTISPQSSRWSDIKGHSAEETEDILWSKKELQGTAKNWKWTLWAIYF